MKILLSGGGTGGSVSPLLAIVEQLRHKQPDVEFLWLATKHGPEEKLVTAYNIPIKKIFSGKFRRYFSLKNFLAPFLVIAGFFQSLAIIFKFKPQLVLAAGGFVAVPVVWAAWILKKPSLIHQQDVEAGLANKLMAPFAKVTTVTFEKSLADFSQKKTVLTGNPVRQDILAGNREQGFDFFKLDPNLPTILVIGGGTGSARLNDLIFNSLDSLVKFCQVIHITGGRTTKLAQHSRYRSFDFLTDQMKHAYAVADLVISRAGMSVLTELAALRKPAVVIPISHSHQEANAIEFFKNNAIAMLAELDLTYEKFSAAIKEILFDQAELANLSRNMAKIMPGRATEKILDLIL